MKRLTIVFMLCIAFLIGGRLILYLRPYLFHNVVPSVNPTLGPGIHQTLLIAVSYTGKETLTLNLTQNNKDFEDLHLKWFPYKRIRYFPSSSPINLNISGVNNIFLYLVPYGKAHASGLHGIGNTLFAIASTIGIAQQNNRSVILDNSARNLTQWFPHIFENLTIGIPNASKWEGLDYWKYFDTPFYKQDLFYKLPANKNLAAYGCPLSYRYFSNLLPEFKRRFKLNSSLTQRVKNYFDTSPALGGPSCVKIGVHIRHGDKAANLKE